MSSPPKQAAPDADWRAKRRRRLQNWLTPPDIHFQNPTAALNYRDRAGRIIKALDLETPDRVPVQIPPGSFPAYYAGYDLKTITYDYEKMKAAWLKFAFDIDADTTHGAAYAFPGKAYETLGYKLYQWPGYGLNDQVPMIQFIEKAYMRDDEYHAYINNPADFMLRCFLPRTWGAFAPMAGLAAINSFQGLAHHFLGAARMDGFRQMLESVVKAADEIERWRAVVNECQQITQEAGYPLWQGAMTLAPFDTIADLLRGTHGAMLDIFRRPEQLLEAMERTVPLSLQSVKEAADRSICPIVFIPMHKGCDQFMSEAHFKKFYWPSFRKLLLGIIAEGIIPTMVVDGTYSQGRLECIRELPSGSVLWTFEQTDMALAKKILGGHACIAGNLTGQLLYTGTARDVEKYCRWLIDTCAPGGGYILSMGVSVDKVNPDNIKAIVQTAKEYGARRH